jgi:hypothetical protein
MLINLNCCDGSNVAKEKTTCDAIAAAKGRGEEARETMQLQIFAFLKGTRPGAVTKAFGKP